MDQGRSDLQNVGSKILIARSNVTAKADETCKSWKETGESRKQLKVVKDAAGWYQEDGSVTE